MAKKKIKFGLAFVILLAILTTVWSASAQTLAEVEAGDYLALDKETLVAKLGFTPLDQYCEDVSQFKRTCVVQTSVDVDYPCYIDGKTIICPSITSKAVGVWKDKLSSTDKSLLQSFQVPLTNTAEPTRFNEEKNVTEANILYLNPLVKQTIDVGLEAQGSVKIGFGTNTFNITNFYYGWGENVSIDAGVELEPFDYLCTLPQTSNLVGRWDFRTNGQDTSGQGNNGTVSGATHTYERYDFDGTNDYLSMGNLSSLNLSNRTITVSAWVKPDVVNTWNQASIVSKTGTSVNQFGFGITNVGLARFDVYNSSGSYSYVSCTTLVAGTWNHLAGFYNNTHIGLYVNGVACTPVAWTDPIGDKYANLEIGREVTNSRYFDGSVEDVHFWNTSLSNSEMLQDYNCGRYNTSRVGVFTGGALLASGNSARWVSMQYGVSSGTGVHDNITSGLVGRWDFEGSANDTSGNANHGTVSGATLTNAGQVGQAYNYDGNDLINVSDSSVFYFGITSNFSISAWVKPTLVDGANHYVFSRGTGIGDNIDLRIATNNAFQLNTQIGGSWTERALSSTVPVAGTWYHVVGVIDRTGNNKIYVNGVDATTSTTENTTANFSFVGGNIGLGGNYGASYFTGSIDEVRVFSRALSALEVSTMYNQSKGNYSIESRYRVANYTAVNTSDAGLVSYWSLHRNDSSNLGIADANLVAHYKFEGNALDSSGNGNTGTISGASVTNKGFIGSAYEYDGVNDGITITNSSLLQNFTSFAVGGWVYAKSNPIPAEPALFMGGNYNWGCTWYTPLGNLIYCYVNGGTQSVVSGAVSFNRWYHVVETYNGSVINLYVDGVPTYNSNYVGGTGIPTSFTIGRRSASAYFNGNIDEVRFYNTSLSASQVKEWYAREAGTFDSKGSNHGTLSGNPDRIGGLFEGNEATLFDGATQYINLGNASALKPTTAITVSAWVRPLGTNPVTFSGIVNNPYDLTLLKGYDLEYSPTNFYSSLHTTNDNFDTVTSTTVPVYGNWYNVVMTWNGTIQTLYVNGVSEGTPTSTTGTIEYANSFVSIGGYSRSGLRYTNGSIDEVQILNRSWSASEVLANYLSWGGWSDYYGSNPQSISANGGVLQYGVRLATQNISDSPVLNWFGATYTTAPTTTINSPTNSYNPYNTNMTAVYTYTDAESDTATCSLIYNGSTNQSTSLVNTSQQLNFTTQENTEGIRAFYISCVEDVTNGFTTNSSSYNFVYDITAPSFANDSQNGTVHYNNVAPSINNTITDNYGTDTVKIEVENPLGNKNNYTITNKYGNSSHAVTGWETQATYYYSPNISQIGTYYYKWFATDKAGSTSSSNTFTFDVLDSSFPDYGGGTSFSASAPSIDLIKSVAELEFAGILTPSNIGTTCWKYYGENGVFVCSQKVESNTVITACNGVGVECSITNNGYTILLTSTFLDNNSFFETKDYEVKLSFNDSSLNVSRTVASFSILNLGWHFPIKPINNSFSAKWLLEKRGEEIVGIRLLPIIIFLLGLAVLTWAGNKVVQ